MPTPGEVFQQFHDAHTTEEWGSVAIPPERIGGSPTHTYLYPDGAEVQGATVGMSVMKPPPRGAHECAKKIAHYWQILVDRASNDFYDLKDSLMRAPSNSPDGKELLREKQKQVRKLQRRLAKAEKQVEKTHPQYMTPEERAENERFAIQQEARIGQLQAEIDKIEI